MASAQSNHLSEQAYLRKENINLRQSLLDVSERLSLQNLEKNEELLGLEEELFEANHKYSEMRKGWWSSIFANIILFAIAFSFFASAYGG